MAGFNIIQILSNRDKQRKIAFFKAQDHALGIKRPKRKKKNHKRKK